MDNLRFRSRVLWLVHTDDHKGAVNLLLERLRVMQSSEDLKIVARTSTSAVEEPPRKKRRRGGATCVPQPCHGTDSGSIGKCSCPGSEEEVLEDIITAQTPAKCKSKGDCGRAEGSIPQRASGARDPRKRSHRTPTAITTAATATIPTATTAKTRNRTRGLVAPTSTISAELAGNQGAMPVHRPVVRQYKSDWTCKTASVSICNSLRFDHPPEVLTRGSVPLPTQGTASCLEHPSLSVRKVRPTLRVGKEEDGSRLVKTKADKNVSGKVARKLPRKVEKATVDLSPKLLGIPSRTFARVLRILIDMPPRKTPTLLPTAKRPPPTRRPPVWAEVSNRPATR
jgi:hypothetical protein